MNKYQVKTLVAVILYLVLGAILSLHCKDWIYLERFGSVIVVIAVFFAWQDHQKMMRSAFHKIQRQALRNTQRIQDMPMKGLSDYDAYMKAKSLNQSLGELESRVEKFENKYRVMELTIAVFGTLLWGFGSVLLEIMWPLQNA